MNAYKLNLATKTLTITKAFEDAVNTGVGDEYELLMQFKHDFPDLKISRKTHRTPTRYVNRDGEISRCNQFKNLTYDNMEQFMNGLPEKDKYLAEYYYLRDCASKPQRSRYTLVRKWFIAQFPLFRNNPLFYLNHATEVVSAEEIIKDEAA